MIRQIAGWGKDVLGKLLKNLARSVGNTSWTRLVGLEGVRPSIDRRYQNVFG